MTYLASCDTSPCSSFDAINARWFKVDEAGQRDDGTWVQEDLFNGGTYTMSLPTNLAPGEYLVRHEILALHLATEKGGAEFYPSCSQITVGGNESGVPSEQDLVSLPGAYSDTDPGILDPDVFNDGAAYSFPGPQIATLTDGGNSSSATGNNAAALADLSLATSALSSNVTATATATATATPTSHMHHRMKTVHCSSTATASDSTSASATSTASASESTITSFAVTSTIDLVARSSPSATVIADIVDANIIDAATGLQPRRISRIMRDLAA